MKIRVIVGWHDTNEPQYERPERVETVDIEHMHDKSVHFFTIDIKIGRRQKNLSKRVHLKCMNQNTNYLDSFILWALSRRYSFISQLRFFMNWRQHACKHL